MKREFLKELGIADDVLDKIMAENGKDIEGLKTQVEKDKNAISALTTERDGLKTQLAEANKQIDGFRDLDIEGVKKQADEWKAKAEQAQKDAEKQLAELKFDHALDAKLSGAKAKDAQLVKTLLKRDDLKLTEDGNILGLDDQLSKIKEEREYLFEPEDGDPILIKGGTGGSGGGSDDLNDVRAIMGLPQIKD